ncbi:MAG: type II secretion system protein, partial [Patescibacteria group bacterium]
MQGIGNRLQGIVKAMGTIFVMRHYSLKPKTYKLSRGFTLIEMIVSVGLFAVVMIICVAALLSLVDANKKAQAIQSVMNNLNVAVDGMVRSIRMGTNYHCGTDLSVTSGLPSSRDCAYPGESFFQFEPFHDCSAQGTNCDMDGNIPPT